MLARVSSKRSRVAPTRQARASAAPAAPAARAPAAASTSGADASKRLDELLASYVAQNAPQTKKLTYSLKPADQQKGQNFTYPADVPAPFMRQPAGLFNYVGNNEQMASARFGLKVLKSQSKFEVQATYLDFTRTKNKEIDVNINPTTMTPAQIYDYYQATLKAGDAELIASTNNKKTFDTAEQAVKYAFGDSVEFFLDDELTQKVTADAVVKAVAAGKASFKFAPKGNWALPQELAAEIKTLSTK